MPLFVLSAGVCVALIAFAAIAWWAKQKRDDQAHLETFQVPRPRGYYSREHVEIIQNVLTWLDFDKLNKDVSDIIPVLLATGQSGIKALAQSEPYLTAKEAERRLEQAKRLSRKHMPPQRY